MAITAPGATPKDRLIGSLADLGPHSSIIDRPERKELILRIQHPRSLTNFYQLSINYDDISKDETGTVKAVAKWITSITKSMASTPEEEKMFDLTAYIEEQPVVVPKKKLGTWALHDDDK